MMESGTRQKRKSIDISEIQVGNTATFDSQMTMSEQVKQGMQIGRL